MPERQWSDQVNLNNNQKTIELLPPKHNKNNGLPTYCYFWPTLSFSNEVWGQTFLIAGNRGGMANSTAKSENRNENESDGLVRLISKSRRRLWNVRMPDLKMLENVLKSKETATVHARKYFSWGLERNWDENGQKRPFASYSFIRNLSGVNGLTYLCPVSP